MRPFAAAAQVKGRAYSLPLQRRITDFGADVAFARIPDKIKEHYGITVPISSARVLVERHAETMREEHDLKTEVPPKPGVACLVASLDGTMIPLVELDETTQQDRRRTREVHWKEARLALAHPKGSVHPVFAVTLGSADEAGHALKHTALEAGMGQQSQVHCLGDGASWIAKQVEDRFGGQGHFLLDFYHVSEYLAAASKRCAPETSRTWLTKQQHRMKTGYVSEVVSALEAHLEPVCVVDSQAPVRCCHRYIINRVGQFDYAGALASGLPIGSGEIESAHRYVIQDRLKLAGAWWKQDKAEAMLFLRVVRANGEWEAYWENGGKKAA